ncbi:MAG TPA: universal stress protein [Dongiaceae bacterium]|nr:universal stress protein [Dongiaceae bacterium]
MAFAESALEVQLNCILLATDLSPASEKPLHHALAIARHYGAKLCVAHIVSPVPYLMAGPDALQLACDGASQDLEHLRLEMLRDSSLDGLDREFVVRYGSIWEELQAIIFEQHVDLVVVGTHARRGIEKMLLGSVAEQAFRAASCPVLSVGPHSYQDGKVGMTGYIPTYLFATDFSEASLRALPLARSLAHQTKARLILMHVVPAATAPQIPGWYSSAEIAAMRENARMTCVRQLQQLMPSDDERPIDTELVSRFGIPSEKILEVALEKKVDLIILGLRRASLIGAISHMLWATAHEIVCGAGCPILTVRQ